jgi:hypothetical protein
MKWALPLCGCFALLRAAPAFAEGSELAGVEHAYQDVDFPTTHALARHALEAGGSTREDSARLYVLLGISATALGDSAEAKQDFVAALAIDPSLKLQKNLSPKVRDPYLEAQGYWSASAERLTLSATPSSDAEHLVVRLVDPASLVSKVELRVGASDAPSKLTFTLVAAPVTRFALPEPVQRRDYEFVLRALDRYGNVLSEFGVDADPILVRRAVSSPLTQSEPAQTPRAHSYFWPVALGAAGLGATALGVLFNVKREQAAHEWNGPSCEEPGQTRFEQCSSIDTRVQNDEHWAIGLYAGGGALIAGSVIALVLGDRSSSRSQRAGGVKDLSTCGWSGSGIFCTGRF